MTDGRSGYHLLRLRRQIIDILTTPGQGQKTNKNKQAATMARIGNGIHADRDIVSSSTRHRDPTIALDIPPCPLFDGMWVSLPSLLHLQWLVTWLKCHPLDLAR